MTRKKKLGLDLGSLYLAQGGHESREKGVCLMEAVAWFRDIDHTAAPPCVCPTLRDMGIALNDGFDDEKRQRLIPMIPLVVGTAGDGMRERRGLMAADWIIRTYTPTWLRLAKLNDEAQALESLPEIVDTTTMQGALDSLSHARKSAAAAWDAAWDAASAAAWDAARAAAWAAASAAAWAAASAAAWDAARAAARAAASAAARAAIKPTVDALQDSALDLYRRMAELRHDDQAEAA